MKQVERTWVRITAPAKFFSTDISVEYCLIKSMFLSFNLAHVIDDRLGVESWCSASVGRSINKKALRRAKDSFFGYEHNHLIFYSLNFKKVQKARAFLDKKITLTNLNQPAKAT